MKLHDLRPAEGSRTPRTRVGRGIAAGKGKTAGRGTKGQKSRAGGSIAAWFEGGQTPLHRRIPKLRGFKSRGRVEFEVVNVGAIGDAAERGAFETEPARGRGAKAAPTTVNQDILREAGLVRTLARPLKILGQGDLSIPLFVVADAFSRSAVAKIEAAGGSVSVLERSVRPLPALGVGESAAEREAAAEAPVAESPAAEASLDVQPPPREAETTDADGPAERPRRGRARAGAPASGSDAGDTSTAEAEPGETPSTADQDEA
jgi:large subunit ribosomal protein L15